MMLNANQSPADLRSAPRIENRAEVEVRVPGREELKSLWTKNISTAGLFVEMLDPPPHRTIVNVALVTPVGSVTLKAEVVHVIDQEQAASTGHPAGIGLQFERVDEETKAAIAEYIAGLRSTLYHEPTTADLVLEKDVLTTASRVRNALERGDLYAALDVDPDSTMSEIRQALDALRLQLLQAPASLTPPKAARVASASRQLKRWAAHLLDSKLRIRYDFLNGYVRAEARIARAGASSAEIDKLREIWMQSFPKKADEAKRAARLALDAEHEGNFASAYRLGIEALDLDPFNRKLRAEVSAWGARSALKATSLGTRDLPIIAGPPSESDSSGSRSAR